MRTRISVFVVVAALVVGATAVFLLRRAATRDDDGPSALPTSSASALRSGPRIVFRSNDRAHYGVLASVALSDPSGPRALTRTTCDRVAVAAGRTLCVRLDRVAVRYRVEVLDGDLRRVRELPLGGVQPSRARLSADGTWAATTSFTAVGDSYTSASFSTRTIVSRLAPRGPSANLEDYVLIHRGKRITPRDRNYWGVTFAPDDRTFYATVAFSGRTWLVRGDLVRRTVTTLRSDAECPALSPDGTHVVYKKRQGRAAGKWRLVSLDLASGRETVLAEKRYVDDQAEWLDDDHVLYAVRGSTGDPYLSDVYVVPADGSGKPRLLIRKASSPSVLRTP